MSILKNSETFGSPKLFFDFYVHAATKAKRGSRTRAQKKAPPTRDCAQ
jgi:hypothetical protein